MTETLNFQRLLAENAALRQKLAEAEELIGAIRSGEVDALAVQGPKGPRIFTLQGADHIYRRLIEEMNEGALTLDRNGVILYSNQCLAHFLGLPLQKLIGACFFDFIPDDFQQPFTDLFEQGWQGKSKGEIPLRQPSGQLIPFSMSMNVLPLEGSQGLGVIVTNLSARQEIEAIKDEAARQNERIEQQQQEIQRQAAARKEAQQMAFVLESLPQIAWTASPQGSITYYNQQWYAYRGTAAESEGQMSWHQLLHPEDAETTELHWNHSLATGQPFETEYRLQRKDGMYRWMLGRALALRDEKQSISLWVGTCTDIHDQRLLLEELRQARHHLQVQNLQLSKSNVDLDNFVYTASHDLKAPVTNLQGLLTLLAKRIKGRLDETEGKVLELAQAATGKLLGTIKDLTEITKLQKDVDLEKVMVDFAQLLGDVALDVGDMLTQSNARLSTNFEVSQIRYARKNLRSILYNLLSNALKYRSPDRPCHIRISTRLVPGGTLLEVADNGLGLSPEQMSKMFTMFKRFHSHVEGTGIGLYMIKRIVENNGGNIEVESRLDQGTVFRICFSPDWDK